MIAVVLLMSKKVFFLGVGVPDFRKERVENWGTKLVICHISQVLEGRFFQIVWHIRVSQSHISDL